MGRFAQQTTVSVAASRAEIETIITRYGADQFATAIDNDSGRAMIQFRVKQLMVRFELPLPSRKDRAITHTDARDWLRSDAEQEKAYEQACRQRWRALALAIKAKLEAVDCKIATFEEEFLAHVVMPNGQTFGKVAIPQIQQAIANGQMPNKLLGFVE